MNICVFCSANDQPEQYAQPARELATLIAKGGHTLVWGGSDVGIMKLIADEAQRHGGKLVGVTIAVYESGVRKNIDETIIAKDLGERKRVLLERSDAIIVLPGGLGTLDEATEMLELKKQGVHDKPVIFINSADFYSGMRDQLQRIAAEGFLPMREQEGIRTRPLSDFVQFVTTPQEALTLLGKQSA